MIRRSAVFLALAAAASLGSAAEPRRELTLHGLFADGMVLQRDLPCPVWGTAAPGDAVEVSIAAARSGWPPAARTCGCP
jgi:sialate O-acetylesterase